MVFDVTKDFFAEFGYEIKSTKDMTNFINTYNAVVKEYNEQLEEIKEQVCTQLCKWPNIWDEEEEGMELVDSEHCKECPLNKM